MRVIINQLSWVLRRGGAVPPVVIKAVVLRKGVPVIALALMVDHGIDCIPGEGSAFWLSSSPPSHWLTRPGVDEYPCVTARRYPETRGLVYEGLSTCHNGHGAVQWPGCARSAMRLTTAISPSSQSWQCDRPTRHPRPKDRDMVVLELAGSDKTDS